MKTIRMVAGLMALFFVISCSGEGPMGPEGEQGPDGTSTGGNGNVTSYLTKDGDKIEWDLIDSWGDYVIAALSVNGYDRNNPMPLPAPAVAAIDDGGPVLVYLQLKGIWRRLPFSDTFLYNEDHFVYYFNYTIMEGKIFITARALNDVEFNLNQFVVQKVKVVASPASETAELPL